ncbi:MAG: hypothetical protein ACKPKO_37255, partial [Candidatus Fonsibacter sp.]
EPNLHYRRRRRDKACSSKRKLLSYPPVAGDGDSVEDDDVDIEEGFVDVPPMETQGAGAAWSSGVPIQQPTVVHALAWSPSVFPYYTIKFLDVDMRPVPDLLVESGSHG